MNTPVRRVLFLSLLAMSGLVNAGRSVSGGRLVEWIPFSREELTVTAAIGKSVNTVVMYNMDALESLRPEMIPFVIHRQDFVAFLAADMLRKNRQFSNPWGDLTFPDGRNQRSLPFSPIPEESVYRHETLTGSPERSLDCLSYQSLEPRERLALRSAVLQSGGQADPNAFRILPGERRLTVRDISFFETPNCIALVRKIPQ